MMDPGEMISFFQDQGEIFLEGFRNAPPGEVEHSLFASAEAVKAQTMVGLLQWRHRLGDPSFAFKSAIGVAEEASGFLGKKPSLSQLMPLFPTFYLAILLECEAAISGSIDSANCASLVDGGCIEGQLDSRLLGKLVPWVPEREWPQGAPRQRLRLLERSYQCYGELLLVESDQRSLVTRKEEDLFLDRRKNSFFAGGAQVSGGGLDNSHVVDFVLAAVLKTIGASGLSEVHGWRWS